MRDFRHGRSGCRITTHTEEATVKYTQPGMNDICVRAYGKLLGVFTYREVYASIPFPLSLFKGKSEEIVAYTDLIRISLMQSNEDFSIYMVFRKGNGKEGNCTVQVGKNLRYIVPLFDSIVERVKSVNPDAQVFLPPAMVGRKGI